VFHENEQYNIVISLANGMFDYTKLMQDKHSSLLFTVEQPSSKFQLKYKLFPFWNRYVKSIYLHVDSLQNVYLVKYNLVAAH
jgi:hypothetical protein